MKGKLFALVCTGVLLQVSTLLLVSGQTDPSTRVPQIQVERIRSLLGFSTIWFHGSWSTRGTLLALNGPGGLYVWDASRPRTNPRKVMEGYWGYASWSPDGRWLACLSGGPWPPKTVVAVAADGSEKRLLYDGNGDPWPMLWASDGSIYYWDRESIDPERARRIAPPTAWLARKPGPFRPRAHFLIDDPKTTHRGLSLKRFTIAPSPTVTYLPSLDSLAASEHILLKDEFPDGRHFLIQGPGHPTHFGELFVIDSEGRIIRSLGWDVMWSTVSSDGKFVVGWKEQARGEGYIMNSPMFIGDSRGRWSRRIPGIQTVTSPQLSRDGYFLTYVDEKAGLRVASLQIRQR